MHSVVARRQSPAKHEPGAHVTNGCAIILAEVAHRFVVRNKPARRPRISFQRIYPRVAVMQSGQGWCDDDRHRLSGR